MTRSFLGSMIKGNNLSVISTFVLTGVGFVLGSAPAPVRGDPIVSSWSLWSGVQDSYPPTRQDVEFSLTARSPWQAVHFAQIGSSTATTWYDLSFANDWASFQIDTDQHAEVLVDQWPRCLTFGTITVVPETDVLVSLEAVYTYDLPAISMAADMGTQVMFSRGPGTEGVVFHRDRHVWTDRTPPGSGTLSVAGQLRLPANPNFRYDVSYGFSIETDGDTPPPSLALGRGTWSASIEPAPRYQPADMNCDGAVNGLDIEAFLVALTSTPLQGYFETYPLCNFWYGDLNGDEVVSPDDVPLFVAAILGQ